MTAIDRSKLNASQLATVDAIANAKGDLAAAATALGLKKDALRARVKRLPFGVDAILGKASAAPARKASKPAAKAKPARKAAPKVERYVRKDGPFKVLVGDSRLITVAEDHPAAIAAKLTEELGGSFKAMPSGLKLMDKEGRVFATVLTTKRAANFYLEKVPHDVAVEVAKDLGDWSYCWPEQKRGCAVLLKQEKATKNLVHTLMRLHAAHAVDRRTKEFRTAAAA